MPISAPGFSRQSMLLLLGWLVAGGHLQPAWSQVFSNASPIIITSGPASLYPSGITVAGASGNVVNVTVKLKEMVHDYSDDLDIVLAGPGGQAVMLMSDAGGSFRLAGVDLTFSQEAGATLPDSSQIGSGVYLPTNYPPTDVLPAPAPSAPYVANLEVFAGTNPNGTWQLYVFDDNSFTGGGEILGGWELTLDLAAAPTITSHPQNQTVPPGGTAMFSVSVEGTPPFSYQWLRNGQVIVPFSQGGPSLTISNAQAAHAGHYSVRIANSAQPRGVVSSNAVLNVLGPLTLVEPPQDLMANPGETAQIQVIASGDPPLLYQWLLNGVRLADETNSTLTLSDVQAASGGAFSVVVFNNGEAIPTAPAMLVVDAATGPPPTDLFASRPRLQGFDGVLQGNSSGATNEPGEPVPAGGGKSVWCEWIAPADGILTLNARGSGFDTLLNVFTGTTLQKLELIAGDDDLGGFYTSSLQFNVQSGVQYQIALDGLAPGGGGGPFTISWSLEQTKQLVPVITSIPEPQVVLPGSEALFRVLTDSPTDMFQWFHDGVPIPGATDNVYSVKAQTADVGIYFVRVSNHWGRVVQSPPVNMELGLGPSSYTQLLYQKSQANGNRQTLGFVSINPGGIIWKQSAVPPPGEVAPCGNSWGPMAQGLHAEGDGVIMVHTIGSAVAARISVYHEYHDFNEDPLDCGNEGNPSILFFPAVQGSNYTVEVEGIQAGGNITLTNILGIAPEIPDAPVFCLIPPGGSLLLDMPATNWVPAPACQWRLNGHDLDGATNTSLLLTNFSTVHTGAYSVVMSNFVRVATNTVAILDLAGPLTLQPSMVTNDGTVNLLIAASNAAPFLLVTKTNLDAAIPWEPVFTNQESCLTFLFTNANMLADPTRFFRAVPWPPPEP
jgi:subtilisin-like proprotein convertase family protein